MNVSAYLKKLDDEITGHRQSIAMHQLEIARIEDARRVIVGIEERDLGHFGADHDVNGSPVLIARRPSSSEEGTASLAAKYGGALPLPAPEPKPKRTRDKTPLTATVLEFLKQQDEPMATADIREALGIVDDQVRTKRLHGALNSLKSRGIIDWTPDHRYFHLKDKPTRRGRPNRKGAMRVKVEQALAKGGPLTAGEVVEAVLGGSPYTKASRDSVYNVLHAIRNAKSGPMIYDGERYRMRQVLRVAAE